MINGNFRRFIYKIWRLIFLISLLNRFTPMNFKNFSLTTQPKHTWMTTKTIALFLALTINFLLPSGGQALTHPIPQVGESIFDQISQQEVVQIHLTLELDTLLQKDVNVDYRPANFTFKDKDGQSHSYDIRIRPRGKFRRKVCDFPPLKLKFKKNQLAMAGLSDLNDLKLVTHCLDGSDRSRDLVLREYLVYKLYNELTPNSFRVQLAKITYQDSNNPKYKTIQWGILLEDKDELSMRRGNPICDTMGQPAASFIPAQERINSVFQYMVGNTDWSYDVLRNVVLLRQEDGMLVPVPYDFDFSAFVSAPYARPNSDVGQKSMRDRIFMGYSTSADELYSTFSYFRSKKRALLNVVDNFRYLDIELRDALHEYLDSFFRTIEREEKAQEAMFSKSF